MACFVLAEAGSIATRPERTQHSAKMISEVLQVSCLIPCGGSKCLNLAKACRSDLGRARSWPLEMCYFEPLDDLS